MIEVSAQTKFGIVANIKTKAFKSASLRGVKILFVDDDYVNFLYFKELMRIAGVRIERAIGLSEAQNMLRSIAGIRVLVISLCNLNGPDCDKIRTIRSIYPKLSILTFTEGQNAIGRDRLLNLCDSFINRHTDTEQLTQTIEELLEKDTLV